MSTFSEVTRSGYGCSGHSDTRSFASGFTPASDTGPGVAINPAHAPAE